MNQLTAREQARREQRRNEERARSLAMMERPDDWPLWPRLPLKRREPLTDAIATKFPDLGFLFADSKPVVHLGCIYEDRHMDDPASMKEYSNFAAIVDDGWVVD